MSHNLALITGAGRGIGRAIALRLSEAGYAVVLVARTSEEITELRNELISNGGRAYATPCDISQPEEVCALAADITEDLGPLTVLINNAGVAPSMKFPNTTDDAWRDTFAVNVDGAFYVTREFLPSMLEGYRVQGIGYSNSENPASEPVPSEASPQTLHPTPYTLYPLVISIGSTASLAGFKYTAAYTASKHALLGLMRALAAEYEKFPVRFSTVCPGFTRTQILEEAIEARMSHGATHEKAEAMYAMLNRGGRIIEPEEVAETVLAILADPSLPSGRAYHVGTPLAFAD